jgi:biofilm PGA synthesis N-glycosyltransferase PgaC
MSALTYALVTPARNELDNIDRLARSVIAQERLPGGWVIVDDGSDDGTLQATQRLARDHDWIYVLDRGGDRSGLTSGRQLGRDLLAFRAGVRALPVDTDVVIKVDADLEFARDYCARLVARFEHNPRLGIASGSCFECVNGDWERRHIIQSAVWGASRAYRRDCLDTVMTLEPRLGWDGLDELRAHVRGYETQAFLDLPFYHHRREHSRERGRLRAQIAQGRANWYMGYRPSYLLLRALYRSRKDPSALAMPLGYCVAAAGREERFPEEDVRQALRARQRLLPTLRRGAPAG